MHYLSSAACLVAGEYASLCNRCCSCCRRCCCRRVRLVTCDAGAGEYASDSAFQMRLDAVAELLHLLQAMLCCRRVCLALQQSSETHLKALSDRLYVRRQAISASCLKRFFYHALSFFVPSFFLFAGEYASLCNSIEAHFKALSDRVSALTAQRSAAAAAGFSEAGAQFTCFTGTKKYAY